MEGLSYRAPILSIQEDLAEGACQVMNSRVWSSNFESLGS